jgi:sugar phosphate isomerase/epimerase/lysophospholipase L1-like esterase
MSLTRRIALFVLLLVSALGFANASEAPKRLKIGTSIQLKDITPEKLRYAKSLGMDYIEVSFGGINVDLTGASYSIKNKDEVIQWLQQAKKSADDAGITIWSVHMPYSPQLDLSRPTDEERFKVVALQKQIVLNFVPILHPKIVLFHPSFFLPREEKELRLQQMIKSATELDQAVKSIGATMVLENMNDAHEQHMVLLQTTDDIVTTFKLLPDDIYSAIDLNHIAHPEDVIKALGPRLKTLHVSDGTGIQEKHWSPCSGKGANNWPAILAALNDINYSGPFMFEVAITEYTDFKQLSSCYDKMYNDYVNSPEVQQPALRWIPLASPHLEVDGLPWFSENDGELSRLPVKQKDIYRKPVWDLAQDPSGGRIRFRTNSTTLAIKLEYPHSPSMSNMHAFGQTGIDIYVDGNYRDTAIAGKDSKPGFTQEHFFYRNQLRANHEITLYLPLYIPIKILGIGVDADAEIQDPKPFALSRPVVIYGTSITQGASASRSGMSYPAMLGRMFNIDFVNLGFSGNGIGEPEMARTVASLDASCFVLDFAHNNPTLESLKQVYGPFIETIRSKHPNTPILLISPLYDAHDFWSPNGKLDGMRAWIRQVAAQRVAAGDKNIQVIEGNDLIGPSRGDALVDGAHINDLGMKWVAEGVAARVSEVLGIKPKE